VGIHEWVKYILEVLGKWMDAISNPWQFMGQAFQPGSEQVYDGLEFYLTMLLVTFVPYAPVAFSQKGEMGDKMRVATNAILGLVSSAVLAMTWHFSFWLVGGQASFGGTYLAYVWAVSPYLPLMTLASLVAVAGLPPHLRRYALNPSTAQEALKRVNEDPRTSMGLVAVGSLGALAVLGWSIIMLLRCFCFVHDVSGWRLVGAILLSVVLAAPVGRVLKGLSSLLQSEPVAEPGAVG
jgi:hypothetical protein